MAVDRNSWTVFQSLGKTLTGWSNGTYTTNIKTKSTQLSNVYNYDSNVLLKTNDKDEYETAKLQLKQDKWLTKKWFTSNLRSNINETRNMNFVDLMYRDVELMSQRPEIYQALNIVANEACLHGNTLVKLLDGTINSIEHLYNENYNNFWVYNINENGNCIPSMIERVIYKGERETYKITLDDNTEIICTPDHKWLNSDGKWIDTINLSNGDSLMSIYDKLNYKGYEVIKSTIESKYTPTHKIVAENCLRKEKLHLLNEYKKNNTYQKIVIHHKSFNKLNNEPSQLQYMYWDEHLKFHQDNIKTFWEIPEFRNKLMNTFVKSGIKALNENRHKAIKNSLETRKKYTKEDNKKRFGKPGHKSYNNIKGKNNPKYNPLLTHIEDINENEYINSVFEYENNNIGTKTLNYEFYLTNKFNLTRSIWYDYNRLICDKYKIKRIEQLKYKIQPQYQISFIKNEIIKKGLKREEYEQRYNVYNKKLTEILNFNGYKNWQDLKNNLCNHRIKSIEYVGINKVYDFVNSSTNSSFAIKCNQGHIISHNCTIGANGSLLNIFSTSPRIKSILEDLFVNRLQIHLELLPLIRTMCKYGNEYRLLNITSKNGVLGWKQMPVAEIKRFNNQFPYGVVGQGINKGDDLTPYFEWVGAGGSQKFMRWQMAHFRLLNDTIAIPYGTSWINGARQQWRRLTMMEDAMLIYVQTKAFERFVYKIDVGLIDASDIPAFIQDIVNNFKRTVKTDPQTGQLDLSKNIMSAVDDIFIPVRGQKDGTKIDTLTSGNNLDKIKDMLEYVHLQMLTALGVPKVFLNFEASPAEGRNLSLVDIRFAKLINRIQQCAIMELNNIAIIHLFLLGFKDDLNNFTITMNNPSTQSEIMRVEELQKKVLAVKDAVSAATDDGIPIYSWKKALRDIMKFSDQEIDEILCDLRLEKVIATELSLTQQIIKRTGKFDKVDLIYGDPNAQYDYSVTEMGQASASAGGGGGMGGGGMDMGMDEFGGGMEGDDIGGEGGDVDAGGETEGEPIAAENKKHKKEKLLTERIENKLTQSIPTYDGKPLINEEYEKMMDTIEDWITKQSEE